MGSPLSHLFWKCYRTSPKDTAALLKQLNSVWLNHKYSWGTVGTYQVMWDTNKEIRESNWTLAYTNGKPSPMASQWITLLNSGHQVTGQQQTYHVSLMTINPEAYRKLMPLQQYPLQRFQGWRYTNHFPFSLLTLRATTALSPQLTPLAFHHCNEKCHEILQYKHALLAQKSDTMKILHLELC